MSLKVVLFLLLRVLKVKSSVLPLYCYHLLEAATLFDNSGDYLDAENFTIIKYSETRENFRRKSSFIFDYSCLNRIKLIRTELLTDYDETLVGNQMMCPNDETSLMELIKRLVNVFKIYENITIELNCRKLLFENIYIYTSDFDSYLVMYKCYNLNENNSWIVTPVLEKLSDEIKQEIAISLAIYNKKISFFDPMEMHGAAEFV